MDRAAIGKTRSTTATANGHSPSDITNKYAAENPVKLFITDQNLNFHYTISFFASVSESFCSLVVDSVLTAMCFFLRLASFWPPSQVEAKELCHPVRVVFGFWVTSDLSASAVLSVNANKVVMWDISRKFKEIRMHLNSNGNGAKKARHGY